MRMCLYGIPFSSSFHCYLSSLIWVFISSKEFTYFGAFRLITIYIPSRKILEGVVIFIGRSLLIKDNIGMRFIRCSLWIFRTPELHILIHAIGQILYITEHICKTYVRTGLYSDLLNYRFSPPIIQ